jgi:hypothetical protein
MRISISFRTLEEQSLLDRETDLTGEFRLLQQMTPFVISVLEGPGLDHLNQELHPGLVGVVGETCLESPVSAEQDGH